MKVFFSTDWTLNDSIITEDENSIITLHDEPLTPNQNEGTVCLIAENELGEIIATSGCGEEEPLITERFIRFWAESGFPAEMDIDISLLYLEDYFEKLNSGEFDDEMDEETFEEWLVGNGLEINLPKSDLEELEEQWNSMNHLYEIVCEESEDEDDETNAPTYQQYVNCENQLYRMVHRLRKKLEIEEIKNDEIKYFGFTNNPVNEILLGEPKELVLFSENLDKLKKALYDLDEMECEARKNMKKHKLVKRKDLPKRVDWKMLVNSSHLIWNAGHLLGLGQDPNNEVITAGQEAVKNLELFLSLMPNPKFATLSSFQIEKHHGKN